MIKKAQRQRVYLKAIAAELGYSAVHIARLMDKGDLPKHQRNKYCTRWMYRDELDAAKAAFDARR